MQLLKSGFIVVGLVAMVVVGLNAAVQTATGHGFLADQRSR